MKGQLPRSMRRIPRHRKPPEMDLENWQVALRRQFAQQQNFRVKNIGTEPVFSEFGVTNPQTGRTYRVAIRGQELGENYCSCPDFATNTLGTCKHIEFVLGRLRRKRGGRQALARKFHPPYSEVYLRCGAKREVAFRAGAGCPPALESLAGRHFGPDGLLLPEAYGRFHTFLKDAQAARDGHELRCYDDALAFVAEVRSRDDLARRMDKVFPRGADSPALDELVRARLYPYQRQGVLFAARAGRCLIADDMGLGKTVQAIAAAEALTRAAGVERVLIVCPTSLKRQWQREIEKFAPRSALVVEGLLPARTAAYAAEAFYKIVNYDVIHRDLEMVRRWRPDLVILDEAQRIKNWKTRTARSVKRLDSDFAFVLTGTPLENRLEELHSIVEFIDRHRLGPLFRFLASHQHLDEYGKVVGYRDLGGIGETLRPILLRRTKQQVLQDLPQRMDKHLFVPMTGEQMQHHEENREIVARIVAKWRRYGFLSEVDQLRLTCALQNMRMSCDSTYLLDKKTDFGHKADELVNVLTDAMEQQDVKVVIFSQWLRMHELLAARLSRRRWGHVLFHGGLTGRERKQHIDRFLDDAGCRLFLSTDAGGVGLNLQKASVVVNVDQPWNPAVLEQRVGRVHRIGQHRPVRVVHLVARGTIEEGMLGLLEFKKSMFAGVLDGGPGEVFLGGTRLKRFMESVDKVTSNIPAAPPGDAGGGRAAEAPYAPTGTQAEAAPQAPAKRQAERAARDGGPRAGAAPAARPVGPETLSGLLAAGAAFLNQLSDALKAGSPRAASGAAAGPATDDAPTAGAGPAGGAGPGGLLAADERTGQTYLRLPLPAPEVLAEISRLLSGFAPR